MRASAINSLSTTFRTPAPRIASQLTAFHFHDWSADPFARGAYTYPGVGGIKAAKTLAEPLAGTLFFAGEATDFEGAWPALSTEQSRWLPGREEFLAMKFDDLTSPGKRAGVERRTPRHGAPPETRADASGFVLKHLARLPSARSLSQKRIFGPACACVRPPGLSRVLV
jgi:hypothetical protein